ncbi:MAG: glycogen/starch synthase [Proteobacteria bacterium]|nr:glycogen/starch synthase [Pseudomonadota bacterium]MBU1716922.1 glycogen/starch synthase [Pseudomonadota bacterium]
MVTREYEGLAGAGGLKDVSRQLAEALARKGKDVSVVMPLYGFMSPEEAGFVLTDLSFEVDMPYVGTDRRELVRIWSAKRKEVVIYLVDALRFRAKRSIYTYTFADEGENPENKKGYGHIDYFAMNLLLQKATIGLLICLNKKPDIIHCQDGHAALLPVMIREIDGYRHYFRKTGFVVTIHNAGRGYHQGIDDLAFVEKITGLSSRVIFDNLLERDFDPLLAASSYAVLNTVSENYARELMETDDDEQTGWLGHRLRQRGMVLEGITNGINPEDFDPKVPENLGIAAAYSPLQGKMDGKAKCKAALVELLGKKMDGIMQRGELDPQPEQPLFTFIGRLTAQKGVDKMIGALEALLPVEHDFQVVILGAGEKEIENALLKLSGSKQNKGRICVLYGYDSLLANRIYAAGDFFLIPSQYEPCGLTDFIAQLFGNIPIVHQVGGLVKVIDGVSGFGYREHNSAALMGAMQQALDIFRNKPGKIGQIRKSAVKNIYKNFTWDIRVARYEELYRKSLSLI